MFDIWVGRVFRRLFQPFEPRFEAFDTAGLRSFNLERFKFGGEQKQPRPLVVISNLACQFHTKLTLLHCLQVTPYSATQHNIILPEASFAASFPLHI